MTDGTSQGLFIVVAIVIFGIFVVLAYILFEDTLSPALASMFTEAVEQSTENLKAGKHPEFERIAQGKYLIQAKNFTPDTVDIFIHDLDIVTESDRVLFPAWTKHASGSNHSGSDDPEQDDLMPSWTSNPLAEGERQPDGSYKYTIHRSHHFNEYGDYFVDIYKNAGGPANFLGGIRFNWKNIWR